MQNKNNNIFASNLLSNDKFDINHLNSFERDFLELFRKELKYTSKSRELYAALCNIDWYHEDDSSNTYSYSWRAAGGFIADLRNNLKLRKRSVNICEHCNKKKEKHRKVSKIITSHPLFGNGELHVYERTNYYCHVGNHSHKFCAGYVGMENYMNFYCVGNEGNVKRWIEKKLSSRGWKYIRL